MKQKIYHFSYKNKFYQINYKKSQFCNNPKKINGLSLKSNQFHKKRMKSKIHIDQKLNKQKKRKKYNLNSLILNTMSYKKY